MNREELAELHYITALCNVSSILEVGLLSHRLAANTSHKSVADPKIQARRANKVVPNGLPLHDYVNLYICARNPMLFRIVQLFDPSEICVLRISPMILDLPDVVIADQNAASDYVRFAASPSGLKYVDRELVYADYWTHTDQIQEWRHKAAKCAEVLVPNTVNPQYITGAFVYTDAARHKLTGSRQGFDVVIDKHLFFR